MVSESTGPVELRKIAQLASIYEWQRGLLQQYPCRYGKYTHDVLEKFVPRRDIRSLSATVEDLSE